ncbi:hypothetical protein HDU97_006490 [Phlyctochytrium planicorne]|nr:hypothetical protein HDU97_006490 [Phlyctochytrium planicorne]
MQASKSTKLTSIRPKASKPSRNSSKPYARPAADLAAAAGPSAPAHAPFVSKNQAAESVDEKKRRKNREAGQRSRDKKARIQEESNKERNHLRMLLGNVLEFMQLLDSSPADAQAFRETLEPAIQQVFEQASAHQDVPRPTAQERGPKASGPCESDQFEEIDPQDVDHAFEELGL